MYDALHRKLFQETVLHGDETTLQVLKEAGRTSTSKSYMWLYRTSGCAEYPIVLYEYQPSRKAEHAQVFLKDFSGWLHADGYQGYHKLPENIRVVGCWAHARRKFDEALQTLPKEKRQESPAATGECYCTRLFQLEQTLADLTPEERYNKRLELEKPVLDALLAWANEASTKTAPSPPWARRCTICGSSGPIWCAIWRTVGWSSPTTVPSAALSHSSWAGRTGSFPKPPPAPSPAP